MASNRVRRYNQGLDVDQVALGARSGAALTSGTGNVLLGTNAGAGLTTGSNNVLVGGYDGTDAPTQSGSVVVSDAVGAVRSSWNANGAWSTRMAAVADTPDPTVDGYASLALDPTTGAVVASVRRSGTIQRSYTGTKASIDALGVTAADTLKVAGTDAAAFVNKVNAMQLATTATGTSLIKNAATFTLRGVRSTQTGLVVAPSGDGDSVELSTTFGTASGAPGGSTPLVADAPTMKVRSLTAGAGVTLNATAANVEIVNSAPNTAVTLSTTGTAAGNTADLVVGGTGPALSVRRVVGGTGVAVTSDATTVTVASSVTLTSETGANQSLVGSTSAGATLKTKQLAAGTGINLVSTGGLITIENTQTSSGVTLYDAGPGGSVGLTADGAGPALGLRGLVAGGGITLTADGVNNAVTIANAAPNTAVTLAALGTVGDGADPVGGTITGPTLTMRRIAAGTGINVTAAANSVTLASTLTLATETVPGSNAASMVSVGTGAAFKTRYLSGGVGIGVTGGATGVTVANARPINVPVRIGDVVALSGQMNIVAMGRAFKPSAATDIYTFQVPVVRYTNSGGVASHSGACVALLQGLPADASTYGFEVDLTLVCAAGTPAVTLTAMVARPAPHATLTNAWSMSELTGSLIIPAWTSDASCTPPPSSVKITGLTGTVTGLDGVSRPALSLLSGQSTLGAIPLCIQLSGTTALANDIDVIGMRVRLYP